MEPGAAVDVLRDTAARGRVEEKTARRLADVAAILGEDLTSIEEALAASTQSGVSPATDAAAHLLGAGGKRVRPMTVLLAAACFGPIAGAARELAVVAELVHLATLLHDDVLDDGAERRGKPTARLLWGNAVSILAGDLLLTHALERTSALGASSVLAELFATLRQLVDGEVVQLRGRSRLDVTEATYFGILRDKTASLFTWAARAGATVGGASAAEVAALGAFGNHLGVAFQLVDDALDYAGDRLATGKALHADVQEGKLTLPLLRALHEDPTLMPEIERVRAGDQAAARRVVAAVRASKACESVRDLAREHTRLALAALREIPPTPARELLSCVAEDLTLRLA